MQPLVIASDTPEGRSELPSRADTLSHSGLKVRQRIISGTRWTTSGQVGTQLLRFLLSLFLARLLSPTEFGLMAMAWVVIGFVELFKDLGTVSALVQVKNLSRGLLNGVFFLNLFIGTLGYVSIYAVAPAAARLYGQPELREILRVLALTLVISSLSLTKRALLQRDLRFGRLAGIDLAAAAANGIIAVGLAANGYGVWSLVAATLGGEFMASLLLWVSSAWRPAIAFRLEQVRGIVHFSLSMTGSQAFGYLINQADKFLIGVFLGEVALGLYALAQRLMETVLAFTTAPIAKVLFPAFSTIQEDSGQIALLYTRACGTIALVAFPIMAGLGLLAEPFVAVVLGEKWRSLSPLMGILAIPAVVQSLAMTVGSIYMAKAKPHWLLGWQISAGLLTASSYFVGIHWGVKGVAVAYAGVIVMLAYPAFAIPFRLIHLSVHSFLRSLLPYVMGTAVMLSAVFGVSLFLQRLHANAYWMLALCSITGAATYFAMVLLCKAPALNDLADFFMLRRQPSASDEPALLAPSE